MHGALHEHESGRADQEIVCACGRYGVRDLCVSFGIARRRNHEANSSNYFGVPNCVCRNGTTKRLPRQRDCDTVQELAKDREQVETKRDTEDRNRSCQ